MWMVCACDKVFEI